jgi:hypothetical protein
MPQVGFEPTIPAFKRAKTVHALDRAAAVIGVMINKPRSYACGIGYDKVDAGVVWIFSTS